jgi:hypothetical protein
MTPGFTEKVTDQYELCYLETIRFQFLNIILSVIGTQLIHVFASLYTGPAV